MWYYLRINCDAGGWWWTNDFLWGALSYRYVRDIDSNFLNLFSLEVC